MPTDLQSTTHSVVLAEGAHSLPARAQQQIVDDMLVRPAQGLQFGRDGKRQHEILGWQLPADLLFQSPLPGAGFVARRRDNVLDLPDGNDVGQTLGSGGLDQAGSHPGFAQDMRIVELQRVQLELDAAP